MNVDEVLVLTACVVAASTVILLGYRIYSSSLGDEMYVQDVKLMLNISCMSRCSYMVILLPKPLNGTYVIVVEDGRGVVRVETP